jgi:hypothetical protein
MNADCGTTELSEKANSRLLWSVAEDRRGDDKACERLIDSGSIASETNSRPFLHRRRLGGLRIAWNARAGPTGTRQDDLSRR